MKLAIIAAFALLAGCSSADDASCGAPPASATYAVTHEALTPGCPVLAPSLVSLEHGRSMAPGAISSVSACETRMDLPNDVAIITWSNDWSTGAGTDRFGACEYRVALVRRAP